MDETIANQIELGRLAQEVLDRLVSDPDFREAFLAGTGRSASTASDNDVAGYSMLSNPMVDPIFSDRAAGLLRALPAVRWLGFFIETGLISNPLQSGGQQNMKQERKAQPSTSLPVSGEPIVG